MDLQMLGWNQQWEVAFSAWRQKGLLPARIAREDKYRYLAYSESGELEATLMGKFRYRAQSRGDYPAVGDWVVLQSVPGEAKGLVAAVLPRRSAFLRKAVMAGGPAYGEGRSEEQVLAANVDVALLVSGMDGNYHPRRVERYLSVAWESGVRPLVVLNKIDACADPAEAVAEAKSVAMGVPVLATSATCGVGIEELRRSLGEAGETIVLLGSSGVGKSTLINSLMGGDQLRVGEVRSGDKRGRHTTTHRELVVMPGGQAFIDTPGLREIQAWDDEEGTSRTFTDIEELAKQCRFSNCRHDSEPDCAIQAALERGELDPARYRNFRKLRRESEILAMRKGERARHRSAIGKKIAVHIRQHEQRRRHEDERRER